MVKTLNVKLYHPSLFFCTAFLFSVTFTGQVQAQDEKKQENPIGKFFRDLNKNVRDGAEEIQKAQQGRDQLDARPPQNPDSVRRLDQAKVFLKQKRWEDAVTVLQFLIEGNADSFYFDENLELRSLQAEVQRLLNELPPDAARNYLNRFELIARRELQAAQSFHDASLLSRLANVFLKTASGRSAATIYAANLYDQGHLRASSLLYEKVARLSDSPAVVRRYAVMAARAAALLGDRKRLSTLISDFDLPPEIEETQSTFDDVGGAQFDSTQLMTVEPRVTARIDPQFVPLWTSQSADRYLIEEQIQQLYGDLEEANRAIVLTSQCLIEKGLIASHTLTGLEVRQSSTGELVWKKQSRQSVESTLMDPSESQFSDPLSRGRVPEQHPIVSYLLRDEISRSLSTDGRHLFSIESHELFSNPTQGYSWQRRMLEDSPENERFASNEIVAYDFATGRVRWRLGGKVLEEPFTRPLAGTFFFGPPVSDGSDLYVIGERAEVISLFTLNAHTGEVMWSQEIAHPSRTIAHDQVRRFWPCFPAIQDGVIICPTTCGWLVAVDQATHQLLWASRYTPREKTKKTRAFVIQSIQNLNRRWLSTPPVIYKDRILFTPPEIPNEFNQNILASFCFDLRTGSLLWQQEKADGLYLCGVYEGQAIYVGQSSIVARDVVKEGEIVWKISFEALAGKPSGRSVILGHELLVPVAGNSLIRVDLKTGKMISNSKLESSELTLGNLYFRDNRLFSLSTFHTSAFPIQHLSDAERLDLVKSFTSELIAIEFLKSNQKFVEALDAIQDLRSLTVYQSATEDDQQKVDLLEWECMEQLVLTSSDLAAETLFSMQTLAETPEEIARYQRLAADRKLQAGNGKEALQHLFMLLNNSSADQSFTEGTRNIRADAWVGGRLRDLYESASAVEKSALEKTIQSELTSLQKNMTQHRLARLLAFLPAGEQLEMKLASLASSQGRPTEAIIRLQRITAATDQTLAAQAWLELAAIFTKFKATSDARHCLEQVLKLESIPISSSATSHDNATRQLQQLVGLATRTEAVDWGEKWEAFRAGGDGRENSLSTLSIQGLPYVFQEQYKYLFQDQQQRLFIENGRTGDYLWSLPLRSMTNLNQRSRVGILQAGAVSYAVHRGALHALHPLEQRVAWTHLPEVSGTALTRLRSPSSRSTSVMNNLASFRNLTNLSGYSTPTGILLSANEHCVLVYDEQLQALDPITGELLWSETKVDKRVTAESIGGQLLLCEQEKTELRRSIDGQPLGSSFEKDFQERCLHIVEGDCVTLSQGKEASDPWTLSRGTFQEFAKDWTLKIEPEALLVELAETALLMITPNGELSLIDSRRGSVKSIGFVPGDLMKARKRFYAYEDRERIFLAVAHGDGRTSYVNLPSLRASGTILCFSKENGMLWSLNTEELAEQFAHVPAEAKTEVENSEEQPEAKKTVWSMNLIVAELEASPLLLFISDRPEHREKIYFRRLTMVGIDKRTGEPVFDWYRISNSGGFSYLHVDVRDRYIDLRTYNERLRVQPVQETQGEVVETAQ